MRALGVDLGTKRIGIALSNSERSIATPYSVITRSGDPLRDYAQILEIANEWQVNTLVFGLPISLDGSLGPAAKKTKSEIKEVQKLTDLNVQTFDERFTTVTAEQIIRDQNISKEKGRGLVDQIAASIILQAWIDTQRNANSYQNIEATND
ncbi:MAG TPA: Holliday junction resolvase RuvX [Acidimicrobiales bacterium]|nr:Holliday junction resolvase RuvX [Acidimicrobiales bacterium]HJM28888.1 Holliday junction resolvase RuvX [Acidimicrobiales bacterium]HJM97119.1 Holliday junction resolvase RuvX [Acidimicrobiales bacterium]